MATIKSYTDLSQSKTLSKILPFKSADMYYINGDFGKISIEGWENNLHDEDDIPCWSLGALLDILPMPTLEQDKAEDELFWQCSVYNEEGEKLCETYSSDKVDACCEMIIKLKELNLL